MSVFKEDAIIARDAQEVGRNTQPIKTWSWRSYGNHIKSFIVAVAELIANGIDAIICGDGCGKVEVVIAEENGRRFLYVKNGGKNCQPIVSLPESMNYGYDDENERTACVNKKGNSNEYNTGMKTAFSFCFPHNNGSFAVYTRRGENEYAVIRSPYSLEMTEIVYHGQWPFEDWCTTVVITEISDEIITDNIEQELGVYFSMLELMRLANCGKENPSPEIELWFNGKKVKPVIPLNVNEEGEIASVQSVSETWDIGENGQSDVTKFEFTLPQGDDIDYGFFYPSRAHQGWYLFYNFRLVAVMHMDGILKKSAKACLPTEFGLENGKWLSTHDVMNYMISFVHVQPRNSEARLPITNSKNGVKWNTKVGQTYRKKINEFIGERFRVKKSRHLETQVKRLMESLIAKLYRGQKIIYVPECWTGDDKDLRVDGALIRLDGPNGALPEALFPEIKERRILTQEHLREEINSIPSLRDNGYSFAEVVGLIEYKKAGEATKNNIGQLLTYATDFKDHEGYVPALYLVAGTLRDSASDYLKNRLNEGHPLHFVEIQSIAEEAGLTIE